jgi:hypothetical protein
MGCSPARPINGPIVVTSVPQNQVLDNHIVKVDHRVLSQKFIPIKQANEEIQLEAVEAPNILAFDPRNGIKKEYEVSGIPHYSSDNVTLNGKWMWFENINSEEKEFPFAREAQHLIEKEFIKGSLRCNMQLFDNYAEIIFKDMIVIGDKVDDAGKKCHFAYPIKRVPMRREIYAWKAADGVARSIAKEIEDIMNFTTGVYTYRFDEGIYTIDLIKKAFINTQTALAQPLIEL